MVHSKYFLTADSVKIYGADTNGGYMVHYPKVNWKSNKISFTAQFKFSAKYLD